MILTLSILDKNKAKWFLLDRGKVKFFLVFSFKPGTDQTLFYLDKFLQKHKIKLSQVKGFVLLVKEAGLTSVKIFTVIINVLAWQLNVPVVGKFYFKEAEDKVLTDLLTKLKNTKQFKPLTVNYQREAEITISKKPQKFVITK